MSVYTTDKTTGPLIPQPVWKLSIDARVERERCMRYVLEAINDSLAANETETVQRLMAVRDRIGKD